MSRTRLGLIAGVLAMTAAPALAQTPAMQHGQAGMQGMDHSKMMMNDPGNPYGPAEMDMHRKMTSANGSDAAETWTRKMIEHHRGAIAMSRIAQRDAKDADTRQMAAMTVTKQEKDIAELQDWLRKHGKRPQ